MYFEGNILEFCESEVSAVAVFGSFFLVVVVIIVWRLVNKRIKFNQKRNTKYIQNDLFSATVSIFF